MTHRYDSRLMRVPEDRPQSGAGRPCDEALFSFEKSKKVSVEHVACKFYQFRISRARARRQRQGVPRRLRAGDRRNLRGAPRRRAPSRARGPPAVAVLRPAAPTRRAPPSRAPAPPRGARDRVARTAGRRVDYLPLNLTLVLGSARWLQVKF
jgi:hypothetical protein